MSYAIGYAIIVASVWISAAVFKDNIGLFFVAGALTVDYMCQMWKEK